jgi:amidase
MTHEEYLSRDATALAELVRSGEVRAEELLELAITRLEALNPTLNAVIRRMDDDARAAARASDADPATAGPFAGVPFLAKDLMTHHAGHPTSAGSRFLADVVVDWDAELTTRVKASGVSPFGKTNLPEWGLLPTTEPVHFGPCRNPWDTDRTPGGSSGGSGAAVAAGIVPMAGGGDGGGSIRIPASCCGLFGLKPTRGRTPTGPRHGLHWRGATVEHVLTRSVRDSARMLDATHGPDVGAPFEIPPPAGPYAEAAQSEPGGLRIGWTTTPSVDVDVDPECIQAVHDTVALLRELGHDLVETSIPLDGPAFSRHFLTVITSELGADVDEASRLLGRKPRRDELEPTTRALWLLSQAISANEYATALRGLETMGREIGAFFQQYDVLLTPTLSSPPPLLGTIGPTKAEQAQLRFLGAFGSGRLVKLAGLIDQAAEGVLDFTPFTPIFNATGHPAMSVPLHSTPSGLPVGVHLVGHFAREDTLFRLAGQIERARPWFDHLPALARSL